MKTQHINVSLHTKWGLLELETYAATPFEKNHPNRTEVHNQLYFSNNKPLTIRINGKESTVEVWIDERKSNWLNVYPYGLKKDIEVAMFLKNHYDDFRKTNKLYGDFDYSGKKPKGVEGSICLYAHDFFEYLKDQDRGKKIERLIS